MAEEQNQDEILDLTELIEKGSNIPVASELDPEADKSHAQTLNDPPGSKGVDDLDQLLAKFDNADTEKSTDSQGVDIHEKLDMSSLDHVDDMLANLPKKHTPPKDLQEVIDEDLNDLLAAVDAEPQSKPAESSADDELNSLISNLGDPSEKPKEKSSQEPTQTKAPQDDLNSLLAKANTPDEIKAATEPSKPVSQKAPSKLDEDPNLQGFNELDALLKAQDQPAKPKAKSSLNSEPVKPSAKPNMAPNQDLTDLEMRLSQCEATIQALQTTVAERLKNCEDNLADLRNSLNDGQTDLNLDTILAPNSPLEQRIKSFINKAIEQNPPRINTRDETAQAQIEALTHKYDELSANLHQIEKNVNMALANANLETRIANLENSQTKLVEEISTCQNALASMKESTNNEKFSSKLSEQEATINELKASINDLNSQNSVTYLTEEDLTAKLEPMNLQNEAFSQNLKDIQEQLTSIKSDFDSKLPNNYLTEEDLLDKLTPLMAQNTTFSQDIADIQAQLSQVQSELSDRLDHELSKIEAQHLPAEPQNYLTPEDLTSKLAPISTQNDQMAEDLVSLKDQVDDLQLRLKEQNNTNYLTDESLASKIEPLATQNAQTVQDLDNLKAQLDSLESILKDPNNTNYLTEESLASKIEPLATQNAQNLQDLDNLKAQLATLKQDLEEKVTKITDSGYITAEDLNTKTESLGSQNANISQDLLGLKEELKLIQNNLEEKLASELANIKEEISAQNSETYLTEEALNNKLADFVAQNTNITQDLNNFKAKSLALQKALRAEMASQVSQLQVKIDETKPFVTEEDFLAKLAQVEDNSKALNQELTHLKDSLDQKVTKEALDNLKQDFGDLKASLAKDELASQLETLLSQASKFGQNLDDLKQELEVSKNNLNDQLESQKVNINQLESAINDQKASSLTAEALNTKLAPLASDTVALTELLNRLGEEVAATKKTLTSKVEANANSLIDLTAKLSRQTKTPADEDLAAKLAPIVSQTSSLAQELSNTQANFELKLATQAKILEDLSKQAAEHSVTSQITTEDLDSKLTPLNATTANLSHNLASVQASQVELKNQIQALGSSLNELKNQKAGAKVQEALTAKINSLEALSEARQQKFEDFTQDLQQKLKEALASSSESQLVEKLAMQEQRNQELLIRLTGLERRLDNFEPDFKARVDRAAASSAAKILREEIAAILSNS